MITNILHQRIESGSMSHVTLAEAALLHMSESEVRSMARSNEFFICQECNAVLDEDNFDEVTSGFCPECNPNQ